MLSDLDFSNPWLIAIILNTSLMAIAFLIPKKLLTPMGYLHAWLLGVILWGTLHWRGYLVVLFYFFVGSAVTRVGIKQKELAGIAEKRSGQRGPENVWGSALTATICAIAYLFVPPSFQPLCLLGYVASFSTKLADTTASEVGKAYGKRTFLITTLQPVPPGTEGAISLEGTFAGILGATALTLLAWTLGLIETIGVFLSITAALIATNIESLIGATLQNRWRWLTNELVNFINTTIGALVAIALALAL